MFQGGVKALISLGRIFSSTSSLAFYEIGENGINVKEVMEEAQGIVDAASVDVLSPDQLNISLAAKGNTFSACSRSNREATTASLCSL